MQTWVKYFQDQEVNDNLRAEELDNVQKGLSPLESYLNGLKAQLFQNFVSNNHFLFLH